MAAKLSVVSTATGAFSQTFDNLGLIFQLGLAPYGALFVWLIVLSFFGGQFAAFLGLAGAGVAMAMVAAPLFRKYILNETPKTDGFNITFDDLEKKLSIVLVAFFLIPLILDWILAGAFGLLRNLAFLALVFLFARFAVLPPLVALNKSIDIKGAFQKTAGHLWPVLFSLLIVIIFIMAIRWLLNAMGLIGPFYDGGLASGPIQALFATAFHLFCASVLIAFMSAIYKELTQVDEAAEAIGLPSTDERQPNNPLES